MVGVGSRGRKNRKDGASAPLCSGSGRWPHTTFQGPVWSWCLSPGSSSPRIHWRIPAFGWQSNCRLNLSSEKFSSCSQKELGQVKWPDAQMFSHFKLQHRIIIIITSWLIFHQYKMRIKSTGFQVKLTWV